MSIGRTKYNVLRKKNEYIKARNKLFFYAKNAVVLKQKKVVTFARGSHACKIIPCLKRLKLNNIEEPYIISPNLLLTIMLKLANFSPTQSRETVPVNILLTGRKQNNSGAKLNTRLLDVFYVPEDNQCP
jgi:hypothetical protein